MKKWRSNLVLSVLVVVFMAIGMLGCGKTEVPEDVNVPVTESEEVQNTVVEEDADVVDETDVAMTVLGEGQTIFPFVVVNKEGVETVFEIHTDKTIVGEALLELELIAGEVGDYGLYVKSVNGITADYDVDQTYWAFYVDGEYAMTGVDATDIAEGSQYMFKVEK